MRDGYVRRIAENALGALVSAVGIAMMLQANVGLEPWSVLQEGMSNTMGITYGTASILVGAVIIAVSLLCGEPIGLGTVLNIVLCAVFIDGIQAMGWIPQMDTLWGGLLMLAAGLEILVIGTWLYMRTALGAGPRDSLMVALARKTGRSVGICRATVEIAVIAAGWLLGGQGGGAGLPVQPEFQTASLPGVGAAPGEPSGDAAQSAPAGPEGLLSIFLPFIRFGPKKEGLYAAAAADLLCDRGGAGQHQQGGGEAVHHPAQSEQGHLQPGE